jgi:DNA helicase-2/ATP-dependent DNA helicase PcrA
MYVAVTRAKDHLFLSAAQSRMEYGQEKCYPLSEFLEDLPDDKIETLMLTNGGGNYSSSDSSG